MSVGNEDRGIAVEICRKDIGQLQGLLELRMLPVEEARHLVVLERHCPALELDGIVRNGGHVQGETCLVEMVHGQQRFRRMVPVEKKLPLSVSRYGSSAPIIRIFFAPILKVRIIGATQIGLRRSRLVQGMAGGQECILHRRVGTILVSHILGGHGTPHRVGLLSGN
ncbi:MAG: hypothetical protein J0I23_06300 [Rhizobiales bacterium]|nr:hypothetical protein [Hyphomicrobiales bacterium]